MKNNIQIIFFYNDGKALMKHCNEKTLKKALDYVDSAILLRDDILKVEISKC